MKFYNHEEVLDKVLGPKGNIERDEHEANIQSFLMGEALKQARLSKNLTQEELSKRTGIHQSDISKLEKGTRNPSLKLLQRLAEGMDMFLKIEFVPKKQGTK